MNQRSTWSMCLLLAITESAMALPPRPLAPRPQKKLAQLHVGMASQTAVSPVRQSTVVNPCLSPSGLAHPSAAASAALVYRPDCPNAGQTGLSRIGGASSGRPSEGPAVGVTKRSWNLDDKPLRPKSTLSDLASKGAQPAEAKLP